MLAGVGRIHYVSSVRLELGCCCLFACTERDWRSIKRSWRPARWTSPQALKYEPGPRAKQGPLVAVTRTQAL